VRGALDVAFRAVSALTTWADSVIVNGEVDPCENFKETIVEPVRKSVIVVVNLLTGRIGRQKMCRGNSLPDITSSEKVQAEEDTASATGHLDNSSGLSHSSDSILDLSPTKPPLLPKFSLNSNRTFDAAATAPPLPPKHLKPRLNRRLEELISRSYSFHHQGDWLLQAEAGGGGPLYFNNRHNYQAFDKSLPSPNGGLETTFLDQSFDYDLSGSPGSLSKESVHNMSLDEVDQAPFKASFNLFSRSWSSRDRSNASSPSMESFGSHLSDPVDQPPALPRKSRDSAGYSRTATNPHLVRHTATDGAVPSPGRRPQQQQQSARRKLSEYDNVPDASRALELFNKMSLYDTYYGSEPLQHPPLQLTKSDSYYEQPTGFRTTAVRGGATTTWSKIAEARRVSQTQDRPPPLPPKKRNVMSYMEMFGRTVLPSGEDLLQGFYHTHDLLHNVWQQNMHAYTDYTSSPVNLLHFPFIDAHGDGVTLQDALPPRLQSYVNYNPAASRQQHGANRHHLYHTLASAGEDRPPALPPKRNRSRPSSFRSSSGGGDYERRIPILREDSVLHHRMSQLSDQQSASSGSSCEIPKLAEITKLSRLSVAIPIEVVKDSTGGGGAQTSGQRTSPRLGVDDDNNDSSAAVIETGDTLLDALNVSDHLVYGSLQADPGGGVGELRAGNMEALVVLATQTIKNDFLYQEAFLTTYRTFITTEALVDKLVYRYRLFSARAKIGDSGESVHRRASRAAFSLLVRVVDGLADMDFQDKVLLEKLTQFITSLIENGNLGLARALRSQFILKYEERRTRLLPDFDLASMNSINRRCNLLNFKSTELAEQMTLLGKITSEGKFTQVKITVALYLY
jgi:Rap guanine nucleotide exchange factor 1